MRGGSCTGFLGHRLNPGGNRDANRALHVVALNRLRRDPRTQEYVARRAAEGKTKREAMRCLKRYVAREVYRAITPTAVRASPGILLTQKLEQYDARGDAEVQALRHSPLRDRHALPAQRQ